MSEDIYVKLGQRLNQNRGRFPLIEPVLAFLRDVFTEEQAGLGAEFPTGAHTLKQLAKRLNREEAGLERLLEEMADEGLFFVEKKEDDQKEYSLSPFVPGIFEFQSIKGEETDKVKRRLVLLGEVHEGIDELAGDLFRNPELANEQLGIPGLRALAVEKELPGDGKMATREQISAILDREESFAVGACGCRCNILVRMKKYRGLKQVAGSNFLALVDRKTCIGCGNWISACPSESLSLVRCSDVQPPEKPSEIVGLGV